MCEIIFFFTVCIQTETARFFMTGTSIGTTDLIWGCVIMHLPVLLIHSPLLPIHPFYPDCRPRNQVKGSLQAAHTDALCKNCRKLPSTGNASRNKILIKFYIPYWTVNNVRKTT